MSQGRRLRSSEAEGREPGERRQHASGQQCAELSIFREKVRCAWSRRAYATRVWHAVWNIDTQLFVETAPARGKRSLWSHKRNWQSAVFHFEEKDTPAPKVLLPFHLSLFIGYLWSSPDPGCQVPASTSQKNTGKRSKIILFSEYDRSNLWSLIKNCENFKLN